MSIDFDPEAYKNLIFSFLILGCAYILVRIIRKLLTRLFRSATIKMRIDPTNFLYFKNLVAIIIYSMAITILIYQIPSLKSIALTLFASAGIFAAIIGFASQKAFSNIISGLFIVIFKPFRVADIIEVNDNLGEIENITLRHTVIKSFENKRIIIPNAIMNEETVINYTIDDSLLCIFYEIGISYNSNLNRALEILREEALKHPKVVDIRTEEEIQHGNQDMDTRLVRFEDSAMVLRAYLWTDDPTMFWKISHDLNQTLKNRYDQENIEIPYPHRTLIMKQQPTI